MAAERDYMREIAMMPQRFGSSPPTRAFVVGPTTSITSLLALASIGGCALNTRGSFESTVTPGASILPIAPPPKNRPCPCGSGRKYKKCCDPHRRRSIDAT